MEWWINLSFEKGNILEFLRELEKEDFLDEISYSRGRDKQEKVKIKDIK